MRRVEARLTRDRRIILLLITVMATVAAGAIGVAIYALYEAAIEENRGPLLVTAQSQTRLMETVARFDTVYSTEDVPGGAFAATIGQIRDAHERLGGFGATGDFLVGDQEGDQIIFLLSHRHNDLEDPGLVPFDLGILAFVGVTNPLLQRLEESERKLRAALGTNAVVTWNTVLAHWAYGPAATPTRPWPSRTRRPPEPLDGGQCRGRRGGASQRGTRR